MKVRATNIGAWCLILSLALSACMVASGSRSSGAYFTDSQPGTITGTYARLDPPAPTVLYRLEAGGSKELHWGPGTDEPASGDPIARFDAAEAMLLDFGEAPAGHGDSRPDVFRLISVVEDPRIVTLGVTGAMADFVTEVRLGNGKSRVLDAYATERIYFQIRITDDAPVGVYSGTVSVHVQGWADDVLLPMTITVCDKKGNGPSTVEVLDLSAPPIAAPSVENSPTAPPLDEGTTPVASAPPTPSVESSAPTPSVPSVPPTASVTPTPPAEFATPTLAPMTISADGANGA